MVFPLWADSGLWNCNVGWELLTSHGILTPTVTIACLAIFSSFQEQLRLAHNEWCSCQSPCQHLLRLLSSCEFGYQSQTPWSIWIHFWIWPPVILHVWIKPPIQLVKPLMGLDVIHVVSSTLLTLRPGSVFHSHNESGDKNSTCPLLITSEI